MVLMYGPKPAASLALTEMLDKYRDDEVVLEVNSRDYHNLTGYSQFITAEERTRILDQTFTESSLRDIDQLVHWIMDHCIRKEFDENLSVAGDEQQQQQPDIDIESDAIAAGILDEDGDDNNETPEVYLEAMNTTMSSSQQQTAAESLASLYYPVYGVNNNAEEEEEQNTSNENAFVVYLGYLGVKYPTKQYCRSLSGICYVAKTCVLLDIIKRARTRRVSLRDAEDPSVVDTGLYRILAQVRTHYTYLGLSLARSEGNLFRLNFSTGDIFNSDNVVVGHTNMISKIFGRLYDLAQETIQDLSNGEELDYSVDNARLSDGMVSFTECVRVPCIRDISTDCSRSITTTSTCSGKRTPTCRSSSSRSSISCACRHGQLRSTDYRWRARPRSIGVCTFLAPRLGFAITITSRPIRKTPSSGKSVLNCRCCFCGMCSSSGGCT